MFLRITADTLNKITPPQSAAQKTSMNLIRFLFLGCLACVLAACDSGKPVPAIPDKKSGFLKQVFTQPTSDSTITLVSETECELSGGRDIRLAEYSREDNKLRMVLRGAGIPLVIYYQIVPEGLRVPDSSETYLLPEPLAQLRAEEKARLAQIRAAEDARTAKTWAQVRAATKEVPFVNSLEMKFVPVPIVGRPTGGTKILFGVWDTRVQDFEVFAKATVWTVEEVLFVQGPTHPVVNVSWEDANAFCAWLTKREKEILNIGAKDSYYTYRLPTDHEWSCAVGIGDREDANALPEEKDGKINGLYPWGTAWPPPKGSGNYLGEENGGKYAIKGYNDGFKYTSPVGSFSANRYGLYDIGGNVWQWCNDSYHSMQVSRILRGASWNYSDSGSLLSSYRVSAKPNNRSDNYGFRCVLVIE